MLSIFGNPKFNTIDMIGLWVATVISSTGNNSVAILIWLLIIGISMLIQSWYKREEKKLP